jgi:hypothetical protein
VVVSKAEHARELVRLTGKIRELTILLLPAHALLKKLNLRKIDNSSVRGMLQGNLRNLSSTVTWLELEERQEFPDFLELMHLRLLCRTKR